MFICSRKIPFFYLKNWEHKFGQDPASILSFNIYCIIEALAVPEYSIIESFNSSAF